MKSGLRPFAVVALTLGLVMATASSASAAPIWQTGTKLSSVPSFATMPGDVWPIEGAMYGDAAHGCPSGATVTSAALREDGDYIYVRDDCADGRSSVARFQAWQGSDFETRVCRNSSGNGTWVRCNFDWPEKVTACFTAGVYNADTGFLKYDVNFGMELCGLY